MSLAAGAFDPLSVRGCPAEASARPFRAVPVVGQLGSWCAAKRDTHHIEVDVLHIAEVAGEAVGDTPATRSPARRIEWVYAWSIGATTFMGRTATASATAGA
jgi:hypothetical protein